MVDASTTKGRILKELTRIGYSLFVGMIEKREWEYIDKKLQEAQMKITPEKYMGLVGLATLIGILLSFAVGLILIPVVNYILLLAEIEIALFLLGPTILLFSLLIGAALFGGAVYVYPSYISNQRASRINQTLPFAITYMYSLSKGGLSFLEIINRLAESEDAYGEVSREFQPIVEEIQGYSKDMGEAIQDASRRSPSRQFSTLTDDLVSIFNSGGNITDFLEQSAEDSRKRAEQEQESFIETLELLGQLYVNVFVVAPLLLIIFIALFIIIDGSGNIVLLYALTYLVIPILNIGYYLLIDLISGSNEDVSRTLEYPDRYEDLAATDEIEVDSSYDPETRDMLEAIKKQRTKNNIRETIQNPFETLIEHPIYTFGITAPIVLFWYILAIVTGIGSIGISPFLQNPIINTTVMISIPSIILLTPYTIAYELSARRKAKVRRRIPDLIRKISNQNARGKTLEESFESVAEDTSGRMGEQLDNVSTEMFVTSSIKIPLIGYANEIKEPVLTRTVKLINQASETSQDISKVLNVSANDLAKRRELRRERSQSMFMFKAIFMISFLVYMGVIIALDSQFISEFAELGEQMSNGDTDDLPEGADAGGLANVQDIPLEELRLTFFHSVMIQGLGTGLIAGYLSTNDVRSGFKYALILIIVATIVFLGVEVFV